ncbi:hypothetical protein [Coleofasciculus sp. G2-EDA-02]
MPTYRLDAHHFKAEQYQARSHSPIVNNSPFGVTRWHKRTTRETGRV